MGRMSFLHGHYLQFMMLHRDGLLKKAQVEDIVLNVSEADEREATAMYCIVNDLEVSEWVDQLLEFWIEWREENPPVPAENIVLGEN